MFFVVNAGCNVKSCFYVALFAVFCGIVFAWFFFVFVLLCSVVVVLSGWANTQKTQAFTYSNKSCDIDGGDEQNNRFSLFFVNLHYRCRRSHHNESDKKIFFDLKYNSPLATVHLSTLPMYHHVDTQRSPAIHFVVLKI